MLVKEKKKKLETVSFGSLNYGDTFRFANAMDHGIWVKVRQDIRGTVAMPLAACTICTVDSDSREVVRVYGAFVEE